MSIDPTKTAVRGGQELRARIVVTIVSTIGPTITVIQCRSKISTSARSSAAHCRASRMTRRRKSIARDTVASSAQSG